MAAGTGRDDASVPARAARGRTDPPGARGTCRLLLCIVLRRRLVACPARVDRRDRASGGRGLRRLGGPVGRSRGRLSRLPLGPRRLVRPLAPLVGVARLVLAV